MQGRKVGRNPQMLPRRAAPLPLHQPILQVPSYLRYSASRLSSYAAVLLLCILLFTVASRRVWAAPQPPQGSPLLTPAPLQSIPLKWHQQSHGTPPTAPLTSSSSLRLHGDSLYIEVVNSALATEPPPPPAPQLPRVLILTPVKDSMRHLDRYFSLLRNLTYPPHLLSLGVMDSDSRDTAPPSLSQSLYSAASLAALGVSAEALQAAQPSGTLARQLVEAPLLVQAGWRRVAVARHDFGYSLARASRHGLSEQQRRREVLAKSRNHLLSLALRDEDWVLWLDSDLRSYPRNLLERLIAAAMGGPAAALEGQPLSGDQDELGEQLPADVGGQDPQQQQQQQQQGAPQQRAPPPLPPPRQILVPNCVLQLGGGRSYDLNSWRGGAPLSPGNNASASAVRAYHKKHSAMQAAAGAGGGSSALAIEGYGSTGARYLHHFKLRSESGVAGGGGAAPRAGTVWIEEEEAEGEDTVVRLDAVGGAALLVHAELHRQGLVFPSFPFHRRIETEGLSMMALDMGVLSWGMPFLEVLHN